jgi:hypothetical protein
MFAARYSYCFPRWSGVIGAGKTFLLYVFIFLTTFLLALKVARYYGRK